MRPTIEITHPDGKKETVQLTNERTVVGRGTNVDIRVNDKRVSREHCALELKGDKLYVVDLGGSNGTWIGASKLLANVPEPFPREEVVHVGPAKLRNVTDKDAALRSMYRTLKLGGKAMILEFSEPSAAIKPAYEFINRQLPEDVKLVFLNTNHGFFCRREFIADSFFEASQLNDLMRGRESKDEIEQLFRDLGATHLLIRGLSAGEDLVQFAEEEMVDEIIIGIRRRSKVEKLVFGSTAQFVILKAHCPVVTVK